MFLALPIVEDEQDEQKNCSMMRNFPFDQKKEMCVPVHKSVKERYKEMTTQTGWTNTASFEEQIDIAARPGKIFALLDDARNIPQIIPELNNIQPSGNDVYMATYTVKVLGLVPLNFSLTYNVAGDHYPEQVSLYFHGNVEGTLRWMLTSLGTATHVVARADYKFSRQVIDDVLQSIPAGDNSILGNIFQRGTDMVGAGSSQIDLVLESLLTKSRDDVKQALKNLKMRCESF
jgi:carbon monoxide dehydrogenase subunit G